MTTGAQGGRRLIPQLAKLDMKVLGGGHVAVFTKPDAFLQEPLARASPLATNRA